MSKVHGADKAVNPNLKPEVVVIREGMLKAVPEPPAPLQVIPPVQPIE